MLKDSKLFDDMARMVTSAAGSMVDMKREMEAMVQSRIEQYLSRTSMVSREEFDIVRGMAEKARMENEALRAEFEALKQQLDAVDGQARKKK